MNVLYKPFQPILTETGLRRFNLTLEFAPACNNLRGIVHSYLQIRAMKPTPYPIIPDGTQAIFIAQHGTKIGGAQTQACDIQILEPGDYFGIRFYPGALRYFLDLNLFEITDQFVEAQFFSQLHHKIYQSKTFQQRTYICEQWLLQQFKPSVITKFDHALFLIYQSFGNIKINLLATKVGWSSRHLHRIFKYYTGLSTKTFLQIIRIQYACKQLYLKPNDSLETAFNLGFFDQAHLLKDYKKRLLTNPGIFFERFKSDFYNT